MCKIIYTKDLEQKVIATRKHTTQYGTAVFFTPKEKVCDYYMNRVVKPMSEKALH